MLLCDAADAGRPSVHSGRRHAHTAVRGGTSVNSASSCAQASCAIDAAHHDAPLPCLWRTDGAASRHPTEARHHGTQRALWFARGGHASPGFPGAGHARQSNSGSNGGGSALRGGSKVALLAAARDTAAHPCARNGVPRRAVGPQAVLNNQAAPKSGASMQPSRGPRQRALLAPKRAPARSRPALCVSRCLGFGGQEAFGAPKRSLHQPKAG